MLYHFERFKMENLENVPQVLLHHQQANSHHLLVSVNIQDVETGSHIIATTWEVKQPAIEQAETELNGVLQPLKVISEGYFLEFVEPDEYGQNFEDRKSRHKTLEGMIRMQNGGSTFYTEPEIARDNIPQGMGAVVKKIYIYQDYSVYISAALLRFINK